MCGQGFELGTMLKQIQIAVSHPMYRNPDSRIQEMFACGIQNRAQRIRNPTNKSNPEAKFHCQRIWNPLPGMQNPWCGILNPLQGVNSDQS